MAPALQREAGSTKPFSLVRFQARVLACRTSLSLSLSADRRSQYYFTDSVSAPQTDEEPDYDEESVFDEDYDVETRAADETVAAGDTNETISNLAWDEDLTPQPLSEGGQPSRGLPIVRAPQRQFTDRTIVASPSPTAGIVIPSSRAREDTPLLHKSTSLTFVEPPTRSLDNVLPSITLPGEPSVPIHRPSYGSLRSGDQRRGSNASRVAKAVQVGKSTFGQTVSCLSID